MRKVLLLSWMQSRESHGSHSKKGNRESKCMMYVPCASEPGKEHGAVAGFYSFQDWPASTKWHEANDDRMKSPRGVDRPRRLSGVQGLEVKPHEKWLRSLGLFSLDETEGKPHSSLQLPRDEGKRRGRR